MAEKENVSRLSWFGEKRPVRLLLLAALLTLGVIHFESLVRLCLFLWQIAQPLVLGAAMAYVLEIVVKRLERLYFPHSQKTLVLASRRWVCVGLAAVLVTAFLALVVVMVIPGLMDAFTVLAREVPQYFEQGRLWILENQDSFPTLAESVKEIEFDWQSIQDRVVSYAMSGLGGLLSSTVTVIGAVTGSLVNFFMSLIFALFLLAGKNRLRGQYDRLMAAFVKPRRVEKINRFFSVAHRAFSGFIVGQSLNGLILGAATWLGMLAFGMPYALIVGVLSGATALVPIIGGYIGAIIGAFLVFTVNPIQALWFLIFIIILQQIQGNLVYPRLVGSSIGLPSIWVLAAVTIGGGIGGIGGMLAGGPGAAAGYALLQERVRERLSEKENAKPAESDRQ